MRGMGTSVIIVPDGFKTQGIGFAKNVVLIPVSVVVL